MFTKRHFIRVAAMIKSLECEESAKYQVARCLVSMFRESNPRFNLSKFQDAAGLDPAKW